MKKFLLLTALGALPMFATSPTCPTALHVLSPGDNQPYLTAGGGCNVVITFNANGSIDNTYGVNGIAIVPNSSDVSAVFNTSYQKPFAFLLDSSQRIVMGSSTGFTRLTTNGMVDNTFGVNGTVPFKGFKCCFNCINE